MNWQHQSPASDCIPCLVSFHYCKVIARRKSTKKEETKWFWLVLPHHLQYFTLDLLVTIFVRLDFSEGHHVGSACPIIRWLMISLPKISKIICVAMFGPYFAHTQSTFIANELPNSSPLWLLNHLKSSSWSQNHIFCQPNMQMLPFLHRHLRGRDIFGDRPVPPFWSLIRVKMPSPSYCGWKKSPVQRWFVQGSAGFLPSQAMVIYGEQVSEYTVDRLLRFMVTYCGDFNICTAIFNQPTSSKRVC